MMKIACPHCNVVGTVPDLFARAGDPPIFCHHCLKHFFVPVMFLPPTGRQIILTCDECGADSQLDEDLHQEIRDKKFPLFCRKCHHKLQKNTGQERPAADQDLPQKTASRNIFNWHASLLFVVLGFLLTAAAIIAAHENMIGRAWLDGILALLPEEQATLQVIIEFFRPNPVS